MSYVQGAVWLFSEHISLEYRKKMEELTNVHYTTSVQHKTVTSSWLKRDKQDSKHLGKNKIFLAIFGR